MTSDYRLGCPKNACTLFLLCVATAIALPAQTFKSMISFDGSNGVNPNAGLVQATNGLFYGATFQGGANGGYQGTVFRMTRKGMLTSLHTFVGTDGSFPYAGLVQGTDGNFYGTTQDGGTNANTNCSNGCGTVFKMTAGGTLTTLYNFCSQTNCTDGAIPVAGLVQGTDGNFYGTTTAGGSGNNCANFQPRGCGTVFKITPQATLTTLHSFNFTDGYQPWGTLVQGTDGNFYGTTAEGVVSGTSCGFGCGTVFKMTAAGRLTTLHTFDFTDGAFPESGLVQAADGNFYGTTSAGGANSCMILGLNFGCGTVFKITADRTLTVLYNFCAQSGCTDGWGPHAALVQATDGNFYGTTTYGEANSACGTFGCGTVFNITAGATLATLHTFDDTDGAEPSDALLQATNGIFYGTTFGGGAFNAGTVFSLSVRLGPFVKTMPTSGKIGRKVEILGTDLTGATSVTFNGVAATFTVVQASEIKTTVPTGATTGKVQVVTPTGTLSSNVVFRVP